MNRYVIINAPKTPSVIDVKDAKIFKTEYAGHAIDMIRDICASDPSAEIHVYGGDGSVFESINAVMTAGCANESVMYIHPFGTGNDFVRNFSQDQYGKPHTIDLIRFNEKYAANEINVGFDCDVVCMTQKVKKMKIFKGGAAYMVSILLSLLKPMGKQISLLVTDENGNTEEINSNLLLCLVANGGYYGGGFNCAPRAELDDGLLEFLTVKKISRIKFLMFFLGFKKGKHIQSDGTLHHKYAKFLTYKRVKSVEFHNIGDICADGEIFSFDNLSLTVQEKAIRVCVMPQAK